MSKETSLSEPAERYPYPPKPARQREDLVTEALALCLTAFCLCIASIATFGILGSIGLLFKMFA